MQFVLNVSLLGPVKIEWGGKSLEEFESRKARALLCYLIVQSRPIPRNKLAQFFWGDKTEPRGRANLSRVLHSFSTILPDCFTARADAIQFHRPNNFWLDIEALEAAIAKGNVSALETAVNIYRDEFMSGLFLDNCPEFETWLLTKRERYHQMAAQALSDLGDQYTYLGKHRQGLAAATRLLELDRWREEAHRQKIKLLAYDGQYSAALKQYEICCKMLAEELNVEPSWETEILVERIRSARSQPCRSTAVEGPALVGRRANLADIAELLDDPKQRLISINGPGGIGKTSLARAAGDMHARDFLNGVLFVSLSCKNSDLSLVQAVAKAADLSYLAKADLRETVVKHFRPLEILLILDGLDNNTSTSKMGVIELLLTNAPGLRIIVTSRRRHYMPGAQYLELQGLSYRAENESAGRPTKETSAVELFLQTARTVNMDFEPNDEDLKAINTICQALDGMPLGIELAAKWLSTTSCARIADNVKQNWDFLADPVFGRPERHSKLLKLFDESWEQLTKKEQTVMRMMSIFTGGFRNRTAIEVSGASIPLLMSLVQKSVLRWNVTTSRHELLRPWRNYVSQKLAEKPEEKRSAELQMCHYYARFLQRRQEANGSRKSGRRVSVDEELENLKAAAHYAAVHGHTEMIDLFEKIPETVNGNLSA